MESRPVQLRFSCVAESSGVILPKEVLASLGVAGKAGAKLTLLRRPEGGFELRHADAKFERKLALLRDTIKRYRNTLLELAK